MVTEAKTARSQRTRAALLDALNLHIRDHGSFTAKEIASVVGCTTGTFWAHFEDKDDAIAAVFSEALADLVDLTNEVFGDSPRGLVAMRSEVDHWALGTVDRMIDYFSTRVLLYRLAISRLPEHRAIREAFRMAEGATIACVADCLNSKTTLDDAAVIVAFCQGLNNPIILRSAPGSRARRQLGAALALLVRGA